MSQAQPPGLPELSAPITVFLNLTRQCNLRCVYCVSEAVPPHGQRNAELSDAEMLSLIDRLIAARVFRYSLTGGEPFLRRPLLFAILERLKSSAHAVLYTNGTLITRDDAQRLGQLGGNLTVCLSIDASIEEVNALTRGRHTLGKTLNAARYLGEQHVRLRVNCVVTSRNARAIPQLIECLKQYEIRELVLIKLQPVGYASRVPELALDNNSTRVLSRIVAELASAGNGMSIVNRSDDWGDYNEVLARYRAREKEAGCCQSTLLPCSAGIDQCAITAEGWVVPCNLMCDYRCGNVRNQDILTIWQDSPAFKTLRHLRATPIRTVTDCAECQYNSFCRGGCRALAWVSTGTLLGRDPTCPYYKGNPTGQTEPTELRPGMGCQRDKLVNAPSGLRVI